MESSGSAGPPSLAERAKAIILTPKSEWKRITGEDDTTTRTVTTGYFVPLALLGPVCGVIGTILYGGNSIGPYAEAYHPSLVSAVIGAAVAFVLTLISFFLLTVVADLLARKFGAQQGSDRAFKLIAYSATPALLVGILSIWPPLAPLHILAFYGLYLLYTGAVPMLEMPQDKAMPYTIVLVLCAFVLNLIIGALSVANMALLGGMGLLS
ncbi:Yip1 family protein [Novosphingobium beihaiensis]|uniref:YIP1 family protein n=1 Tax=Novosphingobium beihaiensis TaxID=2930389 RepID=A0ABT0BJT2_9SPHN|nr:Yip1 family protein [Novosphingobium beihaiensis]MCJ2185305.1 YIP1 family protein [Novosphingobium beihaiensis]